MWIWEWSYMYFFFLFIVGNTRFIPDILYCIFGEHTPSPPPLYVQLNESCLLYKIILVLYQCNARLNQNSNVNNFFLLIYLKLNNKIDNKK